MTPETIRGIADEAAVTLGRLQMLNAETDRYIRREYVRESLGRDFEIGTPADVGEVNEGAEAVGAQSV